MENSIKILLTINIEGGALVRKSECESIPFMITENDFSKSKSKGKSKVVKKGFRKHTSLIAKSATYHIKLNNEAYKYMTSSECPYWSNPKMWKRMNEDEKLNAHLQRICSSYNGKSFTYNVLDD